MFGPAPIFFPKKYLNINFTKIFDSIQKIELQCEKKLSSGIRTL